MSTRLKDIEVLFEFAFVYLTNDNRLLLFVHEKKDIRDNVGTYVTSYDFVLHKIGGASTNCHCALQWTCLSWYILNYTIFCMLFFHSLV